MAGVHPNTKSSIEEAHINLENALRISAARLKFAAAEHMIDEGLSDLVRDNELCVIPGGYVLIEMSYLSESKALSTPY
jgi:hypothetical protein